MTDPTSPETIRELVRDRYADRATACCGPDHATVARSLGYRDEDLASAPEGANLGLGCGNPIALAALRPGETVLDLGSGAGFDAFLAASAVGPGGRVIGVDMTPEMVARATDNARRAGTPQVEFRQGLIEQLPVESGSVDTVISNCVINLSPEKDRVFREANVWEKIDHNNSSADHYPLCCGDGWFCPATVRNSGGHKGKRPKVDCG